MDFQPDPFQTLLLFRLALTNADGEFLRDLEIDSMSAGRRKVLIREGLTEEEQRSPPNKSRPITYVRLTDKGWAWCNANLHQGVSGAQRLPQKLSRVVLGRLLQLVADYCAGGDGPASFGQFVLRSRQLKPAPARPTQSEPTATTHSAETGSVDLANTIRASCLDLTGGRVNVRVRLADLRSRLHGVAKAAVDQTLLELERAGELSLFRLDNPHEILPEDREAVLRTPAGAERHLIYFGGSHS